MRPLLRNDSSAHIETGGLSCCKAIKIQDNTYLVTYYLTSPPKIIEQL